jgi:hypothetical protein
MGNRYLAVPCVRFTDHHLQDNEHLKRKVHINEFCIEWRPVTNGQFFKYYVQEDGGVAMPASWAEVDRDLCASDYVHQLNCAQLFSRLL